MTRTYTQAIITGFAVAMLLGVTGCGIVQHQPAIVSVVNGYRERSITISFTPHANTTTSTTAVIAAGESEVYEVVANTVMSAWIGTPALEIDRYRPLPGEQEWIVNR